MLPFVHQVSLHVKSRSFLVCLSVAVSVVSPGVLVLLVVVSFVRQHVDLRRLVWRLVVLGGILNHLGISVRSVLQVVPVGSLIAVRILRFYFILSFWRENSSCAKID